MGLKENKVGYLHNVFLLFLTYRSSDGVEQFDYYTVAYQWPRTFQEIFREKKDASIYVIFFLQIL